MKNKYKKCYIIILVSLLMALASGCTENGKIVIKVDNAQVYEYLAPDGQGVKINYPDGYRVVGSSSFTNEDKLYYLLNENNVSDNDIYVLEKGNVTKQLNIPEGFKFCGASSSVGKITDERYEINHTDCLLENTTSKEVREYAVVIVRKITTEYDN